MKSRGLSKINVGRLRMRNRPILILRPQRPELAKDQLILDKAQDHYQAADIIRLNVYD